MTVEFIERILDEYIVETQKYYYIYQIEGNIARIKRIERCLLGTKAEDDGWEIVKEWRCV